MKSVRLRRIRLRDRLNLSRWRTAACLRIRRRLETACHLMVTSPESLTEIALGVGFADRAHFSRHFRRIFDQCPSKWRRKHETQGSIPESRYDGRRGYRSLGRASDQTQI